MKKGKEKRESGETKKKLASRSFLGDRYHCIVSTQILARESTFARILSDGDGSVRKRFASIILHLKYKLLGC